MTMKRLSTTAIGLTILLGVSSCKPDDAKPTPVSTTPPAQPVLPNPPAPMPDPQLAKAPAQHIESPQEMLERFNVVAKQFVEKDYPKSHIIITNYTKDSNDGGHSESVCKNLSTDLKTTDSLISPVIAVATFDLNYVKVFYGDFVPFHAIFHYTLNFKPVGNRWEIISGRIRCTDHQILEGKDATMEQDVAATDIVRLNELLRK